MTTGDSETESLMPTATRADARWYAKLILGDDVFISYARRDGSDYVLALANRLVSEGLSCFVDQFNGETGPTLPRGVLKALARSAMLVIVGTPGTIGSASIEQEVRRFRDRPGRARPIVVIAVGQALSLRCPEEKPDWRPLIVGIHPAEEPLDVFKASTVSDEIVKRIVGSATFTLRNKRLRNIGTATAVVVAGLLIAAGALTWKANKSVQEVNAKGKELATLQARLKIDDEKLRSTEAQLTKGEADRADLAAEGDRLRLENSEAQARLGQSNLQVEQAKSYSDSLDLAVASGRELQLMPHRALRLALDAVKKKSTVEARRALVRAIDGYVPNLELAHSTVSSGGFLKESQLVAVASGDLLSLWETKSGQKHPGISAIDARFVFPPFAGGPCWATEHQEGRPGADGLYCWVPDDRLPFFLQGSVSVLQSERVAFNAAGTLIATRNYKRELVVWRTSGGLPLFESKNITVGTIAFVATGIVASSEIGEPSDLIAFDVSTGYQKTIGRLSGRLTGEIAASADGRLFAIPTDHGVEMWSATPYERRDIAFQDAHESVVQGSSDDGKTVAQLDAKGDLLWVGGTIGAFAFLHEGKLLGSVRNPKASRGSAPRVSLSPVSRTFATYDDERNATISILENEQLESPRERTDGLSWRVQSALNGHSNNILGAVFDKDGRRLLTWDGVSARLWDATPRPALSTVRVLKDPRGIEYSARLSPDGRTVVFERDGGTLWAVDEDGSSRVILERKVSERRFAPGQWAFDATGTYFIASTEASPNVSIWRVGRWNDPIQLNAGPLDDDAYGWKRQVLISAKGDRVATLDERMGLRVWSILKSGPIAQRSGHIGPLLGMSPDGRLIAFFMEKSSEIVVWDYTQNRDLLTFHGLPAGEAASLGLFDQSGHYFVSSSEDTHVLQIWRIEHEAAGVRLEKVSTIRETRVTWDVSWSRDGRLLMTSGASSLDPTKIWDVSTGNLLLERPRDKPTVGAAFLGNTSTLVFVGPSEIRHQQCEPCASIDELIEIGERRLRTGRW